MRTATELTLSSLLLRAIRRHGNRLALTCGDKSLSYAELDQASDRLAGRLSSEGIGKGDVVALHLNNCVECVVADVAILKLGAVKTPLNGLMSAQEVSYCLHHSGAKVYIRHSSVPLPKIMSEGASASPIIIEVADDSPSRNDFCSWDDYMATGDRWGAFSPVPTNPEDRAILAYTGGTTGRPKGVCHSHGRMATNLMAHVFCGEIGVDEVMLLTTPLPHSAGYHMQACLFAGGHVIVEPKFEPGRFIHICRESGVTWTFAVPTMLYRLIDLIADKKVEGLSLRTIVYGAAPMAKERLRRSIDLLGNVFIQLYGQTECPNYITTLSKKDHLDPDLLGSCGSPVPFVEVSVVDENGDCVEEGEIGEIKVRASYLLTEYYKSEVETAEALKDGWLHTGDLGYTNQSGHLFLVDRTKDMIISGGMNVYSVEVEAAIRKDPRVLDAAVFGVPHPDWGEEVRAVVVANSDFDTENHLSSLKDELSAYKVPKKIHIMSDLPLTTYGKINKKLLRDTYST